MYFNKSGGIIVSEVCYPVSCQGYTVQRLVQTMCEIRRSTNKITKYEQWLSDKLN